MISKHWHSLTDYGLRIVLLCGGLAALLFSLSACGAQPAFAAGQWERLRSMEAERSWIGMAAVGGKIYAIGGMVGSDGHRLDLNEVYDPPANAWHYLAPMPTARSSPGTVAVGDVIYAIGGFPETGTTTVVEAYDTRTNTWRTGLAPLPTKRFDMAAAALGTTIYTFGGYDTSPMNVVEAYDTATDRWSSLPPMPTARYAMQAVLVDGKLWVIGGHGVDGPTDVIEIFDPQTQHWEAGGRLPEPLAAYGAAVNGSELHLATFDKHYALDLPTGRWASLPPMPTPRHGLQLAYIDGVLYAVGGCMPGEGGLFDVARNEAYIAPQNRPPHPVEREGIGALAVLGVALLGAALLLPLTGAHR